MKKLIPLLTLLLLTSCGGLKNHTIERTLQEIEISNDIDEAYQFAFRTAMEMSWEMTHSDAHLHSFTAKTPYLLKRWNDTVNVFIEKSNNGSIIRVKSALGHNANIEHIQTYLQAIVSKSLATK